MADMRLSFPQHTDAEQMTLLQQQRCDTVVPATHRLLQGVSDRTKVKSKKKTQCFFMTTVCT
jgi:hypothetical protein